MRLSFFFQCLHGDLVPVDRGHRQAKFILRPIHIIRQPIVRAVRLVPLLQHISVNKPLHQTVDFSDILPLLKKKVRGDTKDSIQVRASSCVHRPGS